MSDPEAGRKPRSRSRSRSRTREGGQPTGEHNQFLKRRFFIHLPYFFLNFQQIISAHNRFHHNCCDIKKSPSVEEIKALSVMNAQLAKGQRERIRQKEVLSNKVNVKKSSVNGNSSTSNGNSSVRKSFFPEIFQNLYSYRAPRFDK